jgi:hypothetical protein
MATPIPVVSESRGRRFSSRAENVKRAYRLCAASVTHLENGVPCSPFTCFLLKPSHNCPGAPVPLESTANW